MISLRAGQFLPAMASLSTLRAMCAFDALVDAMASVMND